MGYETKNYNDNQGDRLTIGGTLRYTGSGVSRHQQETGSTTADLLNHGLSLVDSTSGAGTVTYTLAAPETGVRKRVVCTDAQAGTTADVVVVQAATAGGSITLGASTKNWKVEISTAGSALTLFGRSATHWDVVGSHSTAGLTFST